MSFMNKIIIIASFLIIITGCMPQETIEESMINDRNDMAEDGVMAIVEAPGRVLAGTTTRYIEFNKADYDKAIAGNMIILLNFYANWCPICRDEEPKLLAAFDEMDYGNVVGFRVNYRDSDVDEFEEGLAKRYGVTYQHTKVIIKDGGQVLKAPDSWDKERYLKEIEGVV